MNPIRPIVVRTLNFCEPICRTSIRSFSTWNTGNASRKISVEFEVDKLFKNEKLNQEYLKKTLVEKLKKGIPGTFTVDGDNESLDRNVQSLVSTRSKSSTTYQQPKSNNDDWILFYCLYLSAVNNNQVLHEFHSSSDRDDHHDHNHTSSSASNTCVDENSDSYVYGYNPTPYTSGSYSSSSSYGGSSSDPSSPDSYPSSTDF